MFLPPPGRDPLAHAAHAREQAMIAAADGVPANELAGNAGEAPGQLLEGPRTARPSALA